VFTSCMIYVPLGVRDRVPSILLATCCNSGLGTKVLLTPCLTGGRLHPWVGWTDSGRTGTMAPTRQELIDLQEQVAAERTLERLLGEGGFDVDPEDEGTEEA